MDRFIVGDKIKGKNNGYCMTNEDMTLAEVVDADSDSDLMRIEIIQHKEEEEWVGEYFNVKNSLDKFELVDRTTSIVLNTSMHDLHTDIGVLYQPIDTCSITSKYVEKEEEINMNKVLSLWNERQEENIYKKYDELIKEYVEKHHDIISKYKDLIETFENDLEDLYKEENENKESENSILKENNTCNVYKYVVNEDKLRCEASDIYREDKLQELDEQGNKLKEIDALLSMSEDLEYQQSVLIEYGIIDKKSKRMI